MLKLKGNKEEKQAANQQLVKETNLANIQPDKQVWSGLR